MRKCVVAIGVVAAMSAFGGCERSASGPSSSPGAGGADAPARHHAGTAVSASASALPLASAVPAQGATRWKGTYEATRVQLTLPDKVKDVTWKNDDGSAAVGKGTMELRVERDRVHGSASGALGEQLVSGVYDGSALRVTLYPKDPAASGAMTGTGFGERSGDVVRGTARCSDPRAQVVRAATFELRPDA